MLGGDNMFIINALSVRRGRFVKYLRYNYVHREAFGFVGRILPFVFLDYWYMPTMK